MEKMEAIFEAIGEFCADGPGKDSLEKDLLSIWKGFVADGEKAEPLAAEMAKASGRAKELRAVLRCNMHAEQQNMENAMNSAARVKKLLELGENSDICYSYVMDMLLRQVYMYPVMLAGAPPFT